MTIRVAVFDVVDDKPGIPGGLTREADGWWTYHPQGVDNPGVFLHLYEHVRIGAEVMVSVMGAPAVVQAALLHATQSWTPAQIRNTQAPQDKAWTDQWPDRRRRRLSDPEDLDSPSVPVGERVGLHATMYGHHYDQDWEAEA